MTGKEEDINYSNPGKLFDYVIENSETQTKVDLKAIFNEELKSIILQMKEILYKEPYTILFGRVIITRQNESQNYPLRKNLKQDFYDGFN